MHSIADANAVRKVPLSKKTQKIMQPNSTNICTTLFPRSSMSPISRAVDEDVTDQCSASIRRLVAESGLLFDHARRLQHVGPLATCTCVTVLKVLSEMVRSEELL